MADSFIREVSLIFSYRAGENFTEVQCTEKINHYAFYQFTLIPAVLITLSFMITKQRRRILLHIFTGRPGLIFPMDTLSRSARISYACSFGATALLVYNIVLNQQLAIEYTGSRAVRSFIVVLSMFTFGMVFFPVFASLAIGSVFGYTLSTLYTWMMMAVQIYKIFECSDLRVETRLALIMRNLPNLVCLGYLSVSMPARMIISWRQGQYFKWCDDFELTNTIENIRESYAGHHVIELFRKPKVKIPPQTRKERIIEILRRLVRRFLYQRKRGFLYPGRLISVLVVGLIVVYVLSFEFVFTVQNGFQAIVNALEQLLETEQAAKQAVGPSDERSFETGILAASIWIFNTMRICLIVSTVLAMVGAVLNVLHTLSSYRANLFALYRGNHSKIPAASFSSNAYHCVNSIKYAGFQVGYIIWGFLLQFFIFSILTMVLACLITLIMYGFTDWLVSLIEFVWPIVLTAVLVMIVQLILAKFVFLQERGQVLALDNRSFYFNFTYFMFFYNIFLGLFSCLLRILKAMLVGIAFISRLDNSTLPRRFEFMDPGFKAYVGYMHVEVAHTHPILIVFTRLMWLRLTEKKNRDRKKSIAMGMSPPSESNGSKSVDLTLKTNRVHANENGNGSVQGSQISFIEDRSEEQHRHSTAARFNWHVIYTLLHNPDIRILRKGYMQMLRQARQLGIYVPVSDRQADVNFGKLQEEIDDAKEKLKPPLKKKKGEEEEDLKEVVTADNGDVKKAVDVGSAGVLAIQVMQLNCLPLLEDSTSFVKSVSAVDEEREGSGTVYPSSVMAQSSNNDSSNTDASPERKSLQNQQTTSPLSLAVVPETQMVPQNFHGDSDSLRPQASIQEDGNGAAAAPPENETEKYVTSVNL